MVRDKANAEKNNQRISQICFWMTAVEHRSIKQEFPPGQKALGGYFDKKCSSSIPDCDFRRISTCRRLCVGDIEQYSCMYSTVRRVSRNIRPNEYFDAILQFDDSVTRLSIPSEINLTKRETYDWKQLMTPLRSWDQIEGLLKSETTDV
uniref:AlNc14C466G11810 protein n=1 Tax=Albugo laibachii Nc14 TaxID=890382 RepID=F0X072_9STRA|nr:AlNc14C466G11810 [Albugo laibachii Nc14]|eukprot:CCA27154.1 AlNc14C466G11810 [Albugo laibachii Nc14]